MGSATLSARSRTQQSVSLSSVEAELYASTTGIAEGMVTKNLLKELGHEVTLVNHVDTQSAKAWASKRGLGRLKRVMLSPFTVDEHLKGPGHLRFIRGSVPGMSLW